MIKLFFLILALFVNCFSNIEASEMISLKGKLLERGTKKPLSEVSIFILPHKIKMTTEVDGAFYFPQIPKGECELIINFVNYNKLEKKNICTESNSNLSLYLEKTFATTFESTVKSKVIKRDDQAQSLTQEEFLTMPGSFGGDPVRAAQNLPGVARNGASAQIVIQGA